MASVKPLRLYYFVGRCNPPHEGHIAILEQMLTTVARENEQGIVAKAIILLGNGPKGKEVDNPIDFNLKQNIIASKLSAYDTDQYEIKQIGSLVGDIVDFIARKIKDGPFVKEITLVHFAGGKDEDSEKLNFIDKYAKQIATTLEYNLTTDTASFLLTDKAGAFSATRVRDSARSAKSFAEWNSVYGDFYGVYAREVYEQITRVAVKPKSKKGGVGRYRRRTKKRRRAY